MAVLRFMALLFLIIATIALVSDLTRASAGPSARFSATTLGKHWGDATPGTLATARTAISRSTAPWVWDGVIANVLKVPTFVAFGGLAAVLGYAGRRRRRVNIFTN